MELYDAHLNWMNRPADERFADLKSLHAAVAARDKRSKDEEIDITKARFAVDGERLSLVTPERKLLTTFWSSGQLLGRVGAPREFIAKLDEDVAAAALNNRLKRVLAEEEDSGTAFCLTSGTNGPKSPTLIRALHGDRYGRHDDRIWDSDVTKILMDELPDGWRNPVAFKDGVWGAPLAPSGLYASDRDVFAFLINGGDQIDLGGRDQMYSGFFVTNSEVGARRFSVTFFMFRECCGNNIVWGAEDISAISLRHTSKAREKASEFLLNFLRGLEPGAGRDAFAKAVATAKKGLYASIAQKDEADSIAKVMKRGFTKVETTEALTAIRAEEKGAKGTAWDWLQGFTSVARREPHLGSRVKLERKASAAFLVGADK